MLRDVITALDYSMCAEIALAIFATVFLAVGVRTLLANRSELDECAAIPLNDDVETAHDA